MLSSCNVVKEGSHIFWALPQLSSPSHSSPLPLPKVKPRFPRQPPVTSTLLPPKPRSKQPDLPLLKRLWRHPSSSLPSQTPLAQHANQIPFPLPASSITTLKWQPSCTAYFASLALTIAPHPHPSAAFAPDALSSSIQSTLYLDSWCQGAFSQPPSPSCVRVWWVW